MATSIFLGYPPPYIEQWYKNPHPAPVLTGATWFNYYDGTSQSAYITAFSNEQIPGDKEALTSIDFGEACTGIGPYSFEGCTSLTAVDLSRADISIYEHALEDSSVMYLTVDGKGQYISENALVCDYLREVTVTAWTVDEMLQNSLAEHWGVGEASDGTLYPVTVDCIDGSFVVNEKQDSSQNSGSGDFNPHVFYIRAVPGSAMASQIGGNWLDVCYNPQDLHTCFNVLTSTYNLTEMDVNNGTQDIILPSSLNEIQSEEIYWYFSSVRKIMVYGGEFLCSTYRENMFSLDYLEELYLPDLLVEDVETYASTWGLGWNYSKSAYTYVDVFCGDGHIGISGGRPA